MQDVSEGQMGVADGFVSHCELTELSHQASQLCPPSTLDAKWVSTTRVLLYGEPATV